jgi:[ribosomal protein S18]-alanine N-acetyltransferase
MQQPIPEVVIRRAREQDVDALLDLLAAVAAEERWIGTEVPLDTERRRQGLARAIGEDRTLLLVTDAGGDRPLREVRVRA